MRYEHLAGGACCGGVQDYAERTEGVQLQPRIVTLMSLDELYTFIQQFCDFLVRMEQDPTEYGIGVT